MRRRDFISQALAVVPMPALAQRIPRTVRIKDVDVIVTNPGAGSMSNYVLVKIVTNQDGLVGWGDATCTGSELGVAELLREHLKPALLGQDPMETERLWQTLFFLPYYRSGSVQMSAVSGIDMALWDIKGKVAGLPVYELLGGRLRDKMLTYAHASGATFEETEENVRKFMERGYKVVRAQVSVPGAEGGYGVPSSKQLQAETQKAYEAGVPPAQLWDPAAYTRITPKLFAYLRNKLGDNIELLHDTHERITPAQAVELAKSLEPYKLFFLEDPLRPEHLDHFRQIRRLCSTPIAMGEVYTAAWEGSQLVTEHLVDFLRHDLAHCGGVTTGKKTAVFAEPFGIQTAWHGPGNISPVTHFCNAHVDISVPNFGIQEYVTGWPAAVREVFPVVPEFEKGFVTIDMDKPGLGVAVNESAARKWPYVRRLRPTIRLEDGTPWPY